MLFLYKKLLHFAIIKLKKLGLIMNFTHLHLHTEYSLLDGANKIKELAKTLKTKGMSSVAMTDHGNMFGVIDFYKTMKSEGIKPIIGLEAYLHNAKELNDKSNRQRFHICLYAKNEIGYRNLMYLSSQSYIDGFYYYPRINKELLKNHSDGLICSSACLQGEVSWHLNLSEKNLKFGAKGYEEAKKIALEYKEIFGDDFYLEIMRHGIGDQLRIDEQIIQISIETGIKIIATNDTHYLNRQRADSHEVFMCIAMKKQLDDKDRLKHSVHEFYLKSYEELALLYADIPEALSNTQEIVDKCNLEIKLGNPTPPNFKFVKEYSQIDGIELNSDDVMQNDGVYFEHKCKEGLKERLKLIPENQHQIYRDRLQLEIDIIKNMKFAGYMLIVWDFIREANEKGVPVGPGRGSAAGSLVAYSLKITNIDPLKYNLLFERFLNPERVSMPDIDIDFCQSRREEVIKYVVDKYGRFNVAQVITFGSLLARGVIRDVARVLGVSVAEADRFAKLVPEELGINLTKSYEQEPKIKELIESSQTYKQLWQYALELEGLKRNAGMHAAGVVISNEELWHKTPLYRPSNQETLVTQYSLNFLEDVDLIKFDFLGLKTLTVIDSAIKLIQARYNQKVNFDTIDVNDKKVYDLIQSGETLGLFQIESQGMQELNKKLKPSNFEDIIAVLALYRPGPMESGMLDDFIDRKHGRAEINYFFDEFTIPLKPILEPTYGVIVYQEQVMQIVQTIGGFSLGESDIIRRAMGKKKKEEMEKYSNEFSDRAEKLGYKRENAKMLFDLIEKFAGYGFNKSHSAAYAMITFQTTYLKAYYSQEFLSALLTSDKDNTEKVVKYTDEIKRLKIKLLPPDVNLSQLEFSATKVNNEDVILFGLGAIKGLGDVAINSILEVRTEAKFSDFNDFISRIDTQKVNKKAIEVLIKSGAFDSFNIKRRVLVENIEKIIEEAHRISKSKKDNQSGLWGDDDEELVAKVNLKLLDFDEYDLKDKLAFEKETLGFYVSGHPLDNFREEMHKIKYVLSSDLAEINDTSEALFIGKVDSITHKMSKKGNKLAIVKLMDFHGNIEMVLFENMLNELEKMDLEKPIAFKTKIYKTEDFTKINVNKILSLEEAKGEKVETKFSQKVGKGVFIIVDLSDNFAILDEIYSSVIQRSGNRPLTLLIKSKLQDAKLETPFFVSDEIFSDFANHDLIEVREVG